MNRHKQKFYTSTPLKILQKVLSQIPRFPERKKLFAPLMLVIVVDVGYRCCHLCRSRMAEKPVHYVSAGFEGHNKSQTLLGTWRLLHRSWSWRYCCQGYGYGYRRVSFVSTRWNTIQFSPLQLAVGRLRFSACCRHCAFASHVSIALLSDDLRILMILLSLRWLCFDYMYDLVIFMTLVIYDPYDLWPLWSMTLMLYDPYDRVCDFSSGNAQAPLTNHSCFLEIRSRQNT